MFRALAFLLVALLPTLALAQTSVQDRQQQLQSQLNDIEAAIAVQQKLLDNAASQHKTLQSQIDILDAEIKKTELQIKAIGVTIEQLQGGISADNRKLGELSDKLEREKESLSEIMRHTQMLDDTSAVNVVLSAKNVSEFFKDIDAFAQIQSSMADSFEEIARTSASTQDAKAALEGKLSEQQELQNEVRLAKQQVQAQEKEKQDLLKLTKGQETTFQKLIATNKQTAAQIRTELFSLAGGGGQISLPIAITLAKQAGQATAVRPAFLLAILKQETNLGANVGQCELTNSPNKGDGKRTTTGAYVRGVMKPTRDVDPFTNLVTALGLNPYGVSVSCPQSGGYGGAMGPGQFIASTWVIYQDRVARAAGHPNSPANPWNNLDAFTATAIYMSDLGAGLQTYSAERTAALKYFAGVNWAKAANSFYGDSVMRYAADFQEQIDILGGS